MSGNDPLRPLNLQSAFGLEPGAKQGNSVNNAALTEHSVTESLPLFHVLAFAATAVILTILVDKLGRGRHSAKQGLIAAASLGFHIVGIIGAKVFVDKGSAI